MKQSIWQPHYIYLRTELKKLRIKSGFTQRQLAAFMQKPHSYVAKYELGERNLDFYEVLEICQLCGISPKKFVKNILKEVDLTRNPPRGK